MGILQQYESFVRGQNLEILNFDLIQVSGLPPETSE